MSIRMLLSQFPNRASVLATRAYTRALRLFMLIIVAAGVTIWSMATPGRSFWDFLSILILGVLLAIGCLFAFPYAAVWRAEKSPPFSPEDLKAANDIRTMLISVVGAAFALSTLYFTYQTSQTSERSSQQAEQSAKAAAAQQRAADERAQLRDQLNQAASLMQSETVEVRLAGLLTLDELMDEDHPIQRQVLTLLTAYIRVHSTWTPQERNNWSLMTDAQKQAAETSRLVGIGSLRKRAPDVHAALSALGKKSKLRLPDGRPFRADLRDADLQGAELGRAQLQRGIFSGAHLDYADSRTRDTFASFQEADFQGATLFGAHFDHANLSGAMLSTPIESNGTRRMSQRTDLRNAHFVKANLAGAKFQAADLRGVELRKAILRDADFTEADLRGARLEGADLTGANLTLAMLNGATYDKETKWPSNFWVPAGGTRIEE